MKSHFVGGHVSYFYMHFDNLCYEENHSISSVRQIEIKLT